jgi:Gram-negative porin
MKKQILTLLSASLLASSSYGLQSKDFEPLANNTKLVLDGAFDFHAGILNQKRLDAKEKFISPEKKGFAFTTDASFRALFSQEVGEFTYGGLLVLTPTTQLNTASSINGSHLFVETEYGKFEAGSPADAGYNLRVTGGDVVAGSGDWDSFAKLDIANLQYNGLAPEFMEFSGYFISSYKTELGQFVDKAESARKISYYTPEMNGFQFGVSYIPDSKNTGGHSFDAHSKTGIKKHKIDGTNDTIVINTNVRDAVAFGVGYSHNISDGVDLALAATGEVGTASGNIERVTNEEAKDASRVVQENYKVKSLRTYNLGGTLACGNFAYGLSYGTLNKSLTAREYNKTGRDTSYYNGAIAYNQGPIKTSIEYFKANQFKNNLDVVTLATEYKAAPGLLPYAEVTRFTGKGRPSFYPEAPKKKVSGTVFIIGTKLRLKL